MRSAVENLILLKSVSIFSGTPDQVLYDIADQLKVLKYLAGEPVFQKGDPGSCMYIIAEGQVRVHDGDRTLNMLGKQDVFGEMAALDPEPRSASVMAVEDTTLFQLDQSALFNLMALRPEFARGIIIILTRRLRDRMRDMRADFEYMQQFARVTAAAVAVEAGIYDPDPLDEVAKRPDELGQLGRVFKRMIGEVAVREQRYKKQLADLRIEIDEVKKDRQVAEITDTEYFQELREKAKGLRSRR